MGGSGGVTSLAMANASSTAAVSTSSGAAVMRWPIRAANTERARESWGDSEQVMTSISVTMPPPAPLGKSSSKQAVDRDVLLHSPPRQVVERLCGYGAVVADAPNPEGAHLHLFHPHLLAQARQDAARTGSPHQVWCVICGAAATIEPAQRRDVEQARAVRPGGGEGGGREVLEPVAIERVQIDGVVEGLWAISQRGAWRVVVGGRVLFAREGDGCAQALRAAAEAGEQVRVAARRIRADLWVDVVHRR